MQLWGRLGRILSAKGAKKLHEVRGGLSCPPFSQVVLTSAFVPAVWCVLVEGAGRARSQVRSSVEPVSGHICTIAAGCPQLIVMSLCGWLA